MTQLRLMPVVIAAIGTLALIKVTALATDGHFVLLGTSPAVASDAEPPASAPLPGGGVLKDPDNLLGSESEVLTQLSDRRRQLDGLEAELKEREALLMAAEKRIEARIGELEAIESRLQAAADTEDAKQAEELKSVVKMYETMKPKDAARIFDRLELGIVAELARAIKPQKMAGIIAAMAPEAAQRLTVELAQIEDVPAQAVADHASLPKIGEAP